MVAARIGEQLARMREEDQRRIAAAVAHKPSLAKASKMSRQGGKSKTLERGGPER